MRIQSIIPVLFGLFMLYSCKPENKTKRVEPEIHFSLNETKLGAPIEIVFYDGEYHLFYQVLENDAQEQLCHWGHATSSDLVHWKKLPLALKHDTHGAIGLGSVVIDWNNTSGLGIDSPPMIAVYTSPVENDEKGVLDNKTIHLAVSTDNGITWEKNTENSILLEDCDYDVRDPRVIWHEETQQWVMLVLSGYQVRFYSSVDLINWEYVSEFGEGIDEKKGEWTHLDFFLVGIDGSGEKKWALFISGDTGSPNDGSGIQYFIGDFNGFEFNPITHKPKWLDNGGDNYAGVGVTNYFEAEEPSFYLGWINNSRYANMKENMHIPESYTIARKLLLINKFNDYYIQSKPVKSYRGLRKEQRLIEGQKYTGKLPLAKELKLPLEVNLSFDVNNRTYLDFAETFGIEFSNDDSERLIVGYHSLRRYFYITQIKEKDGKTEEVTCIDYAFYAIDQPTLDLTLFIDQSSVELFAADGLIAMTKKYFSLTGFDQIKLFAEKGNVTLKDGDLVELKKIW